MIDSTVQGMNPMASLNAARSWTSASRFNAGEPNEPIQRTVAPPPQHGHHPHDGSAHGRLSELQRSVPLRSAPPPQQQHQQQQQRVQIDPRMAPNGRPSGPPPFNPGERPIALHSCAIIAPSIHFPRDGTAVYLSYCTSVVALHVTAWHRIAGLAPLHHHHAGSQQQQHAQMPLLLPGLDTSAAQHPAAMGGGHEVQYRQGGDSHGFMANSNAARYGNMRMFSSNDQMYRKPDHESVQPLRNPLLREYRPTEEVTLLAASSEHTGVEAVFNPTRMSAHGAGHCAAATDPHMAAPLPAARGGAPRRHHAELV